MPTWALTVTALVAFAANSILCRLALTSGAIDAVTFTTVRLASGAAALSLLVFIGHNASPPHARRSTAALSGGSWMSAACLFLYALPFSLAYTQLTVATGALMLFGAVQSTMIGVGVWRGERPTAVQWLGLALAASGLCYLLLPGVATPPLPAASLMVTAGAAWGAYSLRGRTATDPLRHTTGNFVRTVPLALAASAIAALSSSSARLDMATTQLALASGVIASGAGYAVWYRALPRLSATRAAAVQLAVPVIASVGGLLVVGESITLRLLTAGLLVLGGIGLAISRRAAGMPPIITSRMRGAP